jgi:hypothetical protein
MTRIAAWCATHDAMHHQTAHVGLEEFDNEVVVTVLAEKPVRLVVNGQSVSLPPAVGYGAGGSGASVVVTST